MLITLQGQAELRAAQQGQSWQQEQGQSWQQELPLWFLIICKSYLV